MLQVLFVFECPDNICDVCLTIYITVQVLAELLPSTNRLEKVLLINIVLWYNLNSTYGGIISVVVA